MEAIARENFKRSAIGRARILACTIERSKKDAAAESRGIARVAYLGQIMNIGSGRAKKIIKGVLPEGLGYSRARLGTRKRLLSHNRAESHGLHI